MIFDKKRVFLYSSILLLLLVGVYFTVFVDSIGIINRNALSTQVNATTESNGTQSRGVCIDFGNNSQDCRAAYGGGNFTNNWTRGGNTELFVFKINISGFTTTANNNITRINITLPTGFGSPVRQGQTAGLANASFQQNVAGILNGSGSAIPASWTINTTGTYITVFNETGLGGLGAGGTPPNLSFMAANSSTETIFIYFNATAANGTESVVNWTITVYNSTGGTGLFNDSTGANGVIDTGFGILTGIDGLAPRTLAHNVTEGSNLRTSFTGTKYLKYDTSSGTNVIINLSVTDYNADRVLLVFNATGGSINLANIRNLLYNSSFLTPGTTLGTEFANFTVLEVPRSGKANATTLDTRSALTPSAPSYLFSFNISNFTWGGGDQGTVTDGTTFRYVFVVYDLYNNSEIINNSDAEFVLGRDINNPTVTFTQPSDTSIGLFDPIKYTCDGSDTSGLASCTTTVTKPGSGTVTKTGCNTEHTFTSTDTNEAGTYDISCKINDNVGRSTTKTGTFSVSASVSGGAGGGGGGGAGSSADNPVTVSEGISVDAGTLSTTETFTSVAKEGTVTFTVSGSSHSAKVLEVGIDSVTVEISSTPQTITLNVGETKEVDLTDDGTNDLSITLKSITNGMADLVFKSLEVSAPPSGEPGAPGVVTGEEAQPSRAWLWIVLVVVVIGLVLWYLGRKKQ